MNVVVFFTRGMSLEGWRAAGIAERELALFRAMRPRLSRLVLVTYGTRGEAQWERRLPGIDVRFNRWRLPVNVYSLLAPWLHRDVVRDAHVVRTQQLNGGWTAVIAKRLYGSALVVRCGYLWSDYVRRIGGSPLRAAVTRWLEGTILRAADAVVVAGGDDAAAIVARGVDAERVCTIPNFVDTQVFRPMPEVHREAGRVVYVGRLHDHKNVAALIDAVAELPGVRLTVAGDGPERGSLEAQARAAGVDCAFLGNVPNGDLPAVLNRAEVYVMPSLFEGHPKAIVEAMACGVPVIGTRVPGVENLVVDGETGLLTGTAAADLTGALRRLLADAPLRERLAAGGLAYATRHHSLAAAVDAEVAVFARAMRGR